MGEVQHPYARDTRTRISPSVAIVVSSVVLEESTRFDRIHKRVRRMLATKYAECTTTSPTTNTTATAPAPATVTTNIKKRKGSKVHHVNVAVIDNHGQYSQRIIPYIHSIYLTEGVRIRLVSLLVRLRIRALRLQQHFDWSRLKLRVRESQL